ncbi:transmembrane protein 203 [Galendromus occidentalis]|uniref:Transmembrane protein 203 n=1 Tax=Galendromus occidentalis TaxID=34638 RepID=A0AAJ6QUY4_9ACAR|nr:transmembrane protein 203 [Galendromus occidentalis]
MRLLELGELCRWINFTPVELSLLMSATLIFSFLAALKLDGIINPSWWSLFAVYFVADGMLCYFALIVFIRLCFVGQCKIAAIRALWSFFQLLALLALKQLLCSKYDSHKQLTYSEVFTPLYGILVILMIRACQMR